MILPPYILLKGTLLSPEGGLFVLHGPLNYRLVLGQLTTKKYARVSMPETVGFIKTGQAKNGM
jgi:hypothetical protein